jgi:hypothetical protein
LPFTYLLSIPPRYGAVVVEVEDVVDVVEDVVLVVDVVLLVVVVVGNPG